MRAIILAASMTPSLSSFAVLIPDGVRHIRQLWIYSLASFLQYCYQFLRLSRIVRREISVSSARTLTAAGSADPVDVVLGAVGIIKVDNIFYVLNI